MYISFMKIENYRTFHMITLTFDDSMNFIVGDNNIGKTNFAKDGYSRIGICGKRF